MDTSSHPFNIIFLATSIPSPRKPYINTFNAEIFFTVSKPYVIIVRD